MISRLVRGSLVAVVAVLGWMDGPAGTARGAAVDANRLTYLDSNDPFHVHRGFPRLTTPQWFGEPDVDAVVILAIDDLRDPQRYEDYLRPILDRLKRIDGRAPVSILVNAVTPEEPLLQTWLEEGLSLEVHTLAHPCPLLQRGDFDAARDTVQGGIELLNLIPNNRPVAFRMPCCDSMNSPSPRFYAELFNTTNAAGQFLEIDSSIMNVSTPEDDSLPREWVIDAGGRERFGRYFPDATNALTRVNLGSFVTTIRDHPYPYVIGRLCWEFPPLVPSDWEAFNLQGANHSRTVEDFKIALDIAVAKQGMYNLIFHPHGWIRGEQIVELIDYASAEYGGRVRFLTFREALGRLNEHLLQGQPLRASDGQDQGARLIDLNDDGFMDVVVGNERTRWTRVWDPERKEWLPATDFPAALAHRDESGRVRDGGVRFGIVRPEGRVSMWVRTESRREAWTFDGREWRRDDALGSGLELAGEPVLIARDGVDRGVRLRDVNGDGQCELLIGNESRSGVFAWSERDAKWELLDYTLPGGAAIVDGQGRDAGLRFVDLDGDGFDDVLYSNEKGYGIHLFTPRAMPWLGWDVGWTQGIREGAAGELNAVPQIVRDGPHRNNGAWFHSGHLWVQNEDTAHLPDRVDRRSFQELLMEEVPPPVDADQAAATFRLEPGFRIELVAAEPLVTDPVAFEWGADGRLWVAEMRDYPSGMDGEGRPGGAVRVLEDSDGDGRYDRSVEFLTGLNFPTGVMPWREGVIVSAAPEIFYAEDTDGDGRADVRRVLLRGFGEGNQQHRVNGFGYGLDHWVHVANGDSGGRIRSMAGGAPVELRGQDLRFDPDTGGLETIAGQTQYGRHRDDWGNWFGNNNPTWLWHYHLPERYLARNPHLPVRTTRRMLAQYPDATRVYPVSPAMRRFNWPDLENTVTSANSPTPYRDEMFGPAYANAVFISEPAHNLVRCELLEPDGVSFTSSRSSPEERREFLASTDNWFRPTTMRTGPDGALYIADMYRLVIEHIDYALPGMEKRVDLRAGQDRGRIFRVLPEGAKARRIPRLDILEGRALADRMESVNGWERDTAQRLLLHRQDRRAVDPLERIVRAGGHPQARLQALWTLNGLNALSEDLLIAALRDDHFAVREHAVRLSEPRLKESDGLDAPAGALRERLLQMADDPHARVRHQLALSLGEWNDPVVAPVLARLARDGDGVEDLRLAVMSSAVPHVEGLLRAVEEALRAESGDPVLLADLVALAISVGKDEAVTGIWQRVVQPVSGGFRQWQFEAMRGLLDALDRQQRTLARYWTEHGRGGARELQGVERLFEASRGVAVDSAAAASMRIAALELLGRGPGERESDLRVLAGLLHARHPVAVQRAAAKALSRFGDRRAAELMLGAWSACSPTVRSGILGLASERGAFVEVLLDLIESGHVPAGQINRAQQQRFLWNPDKAVQARAARLFSSANPDRRQVVKAYRQSVGTDGDPVRGRGLFEQQCAVCHRFEDQGNPVGPDLAGFRDQPIEAWVLAILDPNAAVEAPFVGYTAAMKDGRELSGVIANETASSVTLRTATGGEEVLLRNQIETFGSSGLSLMPEGFESSLNSREMSDLIAFLRARQAGSEARRD